LLLGGCIGLLQSAADVVLRLDVGHSLAEGLSSGFWSSPRSPQWSRALRAPSTLLRAENARARATPRCNAVGART
jgi:hypothetical protein